MSTICGAMVVLVAQHECEVINSCLNMKKW